MLGDAGDGGHVLAFGITTDFRTKLFPGSQRLIELADRIEALQVEALCWCGARATHNARTVDGEMVIEGAQVAVGDVNRPAEEIGYEGLCRRHLRRMAAASARAGALSPTSCRSHPLDGGISGFGSVWAHRPLHSAYDLCVGNGGGRMDVIAPELLMALASGTAGAAGEQIWTSLRDLVRRRHSGGEPSDQGELTALAEAPDSAERSTELAEVLARRARQDPAFAQALAAWRREAEALEGIRTGTGDVHNTISGGTQSTVVQARDVHGSINLGG